MLSALLLEDALLKCVVTEVVLFSVVAFKTLFSLRQLAESHAEIKHAQTHKNL